jgi:VanZ family protein
MPLYYLRIFSLYFVKNYFLKNVRIKFTIAFAWLATITFLLCLPGSEFPKQGWLEKIWIDKWVHAALFLALVMLWCRAYAGKNKTGDKKKIFLWIAITGLVYGTIMEIVQHFYVPFRSFEAGDIIFDGAGSAAGYFISVKKYLKTRTSD